MRIQEIDGYYFDIKDVILVHPFMKSTMKGKSYFFVTFSCGVKRQFNMGKEGLDVYNKFLTDFKYFKVNDK